MRLLKIFDVIQEVMNYKFHLWAGRLGAFWIPIVLVFVALLLFGLTQIFHMNLKSPSEEIIWFFVLLAGCVVLGAIDMFLLAPRFLAYFRSGLPIVFFGAESNQRFPQARFDHDRLNRRFHSHWFASPNFQSLSKMEIAIQVELSCISFSKPIFPIMHGIARRSEDGRYISLIGRLNWAPLIAVISTTAFALMHSNLLWVFTVGLGLLASYIRDALLFRAVYIYLLGNKASEAVDS
jgi:hypothetical protein